MRDLDKFTQAYLECALWASVDENDRPLDAEYCLGAIGSETFAEMTADCQKFQSLHAALILERETEAGHDFWLTRNHEGCGFWDGDWPEPDATLLTNSAHSFGSYLLYIDDDGQVQGTPG